METWQNGAIPDSALHLLNFQLIRADRNAESMGKSKRKLADQAATYNNTTDLQEYSETVTAYITKCIDDVMVTKTITVRAVADRGGLQTSEGSERCLQSWR